MTPIVINPPEWTQDTVSEGEEPHETWSAFIGSNVALRVQRRIDHTWQWWFLGGGFMQDDGWETHFGDAKEAAWDAFRKFVTPR